ICYEATYPHLARHLVQNGAQFLVNLSNDTWLAGEAAAAQHFSMVVFRAVETRRPLARVATAGITGFVDPQGRPYQVSSAVDEVIRGTLAPQHELTVYAHYGDWFVLACVGWVLVAILAPRFTLQPKSQSVKTTFSEKTEILIPRSSSGEEADDHKDQSFFP